MALSNGTGKSRNIDAGVLQGLYSLGGITDNKRISQSEWIAPKSANRGRIRIVAPVNKLVREGVAARLNTPELKMIHVDGILTMVDFKPKDRKCRIDSALRTSVMCTFDEDQANIVNSLLRKPVRATGGARLQPHGNRFESFHMDKIEPLPSMSLGEGNFLASSSLSELAAIQRVRPVKDPLQLVGGFPADESIDEYLEDVYSSRK